MRKLAIYFFLLCFASPAWSQFYLRGDVKDEKLRPLQNVKIFIHSAKTIFASGTDGSFGLNVTKTYDSLTFTLDGYTTQTVWAKADKWLSVTLKISPDFVNRNKQKLISVTKDFKQTSKYRWFTGDETYFQLVENEYVNTVKFPNTGFSLNVNKASYSNVRRFLNTKSAVPPDAVKVEEMMNYFNLYYDEPAPNEVFKMRSQLTACPWNGQHQLLYLNINAKKLDLTKVPPSNFVFLIDVSGSMDAENRLPLLQAAFQSLVKNLRPIDKVSIVVYGGTVGIWMQPTFGNEKEKILKSIEELTAAGDTPGESAIRAAYTLAESTYIKGGNNRVILATDGDFNVGETSEKALDELITQKKQSGVFLTCLGVGMGNFKDSKLQTLAKKGNGNYAYIDNLFEAEKVLVKELTQTFYAVADDVYLNIHFNPAMVSHYRLIGFDNKKEALAEVTNDLEGGEIGSGNSTLALFELEPTEQNQLTKGTNYADDIASLDLKYSLCTDTLTRTLPFAVKNNFVAFDKLDKDLRFATIVTMLGLKLKQSKFFPPIDWVTMLTMSHGIVDKTNFLQNEFLQLLDKAQKVYPEKKKKRGKSLVAGGATAE